MQNFANEISNAGRGHMARNVKYLNPISSLSFVGIGWGLRYFDSTGRLTVLIELCMAVSRSEYRSRSRSHHTVIDVKPSNAVSSLISDGIEWELRYGEFCIMVELNNPNLDCSILCQDQGQMQKCVFHIEMHIQFRVYLLLLFMVWNSASDIITTRWLVWAWLFGFRIKMKITDSWTSNRYIIDPHVHHHLVCETFESRISDPKRYLI